MFKKPLFAALALVVASAAMAQEATSDAWMQVASVKSADQVKAELFQARKDGSIKATSAAYMEKVTSAKSRDQVRSETISARSRGEVDSIDSEAQSFAPVGAAVTLVAGSH